MIKLRFMGPEFLRNANLPIFSEHEPVRDALAIIANHIGGTNRYSDIKVELVPPAQIIGVPNLYGVVVIGDQKHQRTVDRFLRVIKPGIELAYETYHKDSLQEFNRQVHGFILRVRSNIEKRTVGIRGRKN